jgi:hypothetical protein
MAGRARYHVLTTTRDELSNSDQVGLILIDSIPSLGLYLLPSCSLQAVVSFSSSSSPLRRRPCVSPWSHIVLCQVRRLHKAYLCRDPSPSTWSGPCLRGVVSSSSLAVIPCRHLFPSSSLSLSPPPRCRPLLLSLHHCYAVVKFVIRFVRVIIHHRYQVHG